jgi:hypothetical protein
MAKTCFVVGPIGPADSETRKRSDALLEYIIKKVLEAPPFQMTVDRADEIQKPGLITQQVIERVVNADLVVADLTDHNPNVFYELALRHATRKPVVHLVLSGQTIPFDIAHQRTIYYDTTNLATAEKAKEELRKHAEAVLKAADTGDNPISAGLVVLDLAQSKNTTDQSLARILTEITDLRESVRVIEQALAPPKTTWTTLGADTPKERLQGLLAASLGIPSASEATRSPKGLFDPNVLAAIGRTLAEAPRCANCGQPIVGPVGQRSADNAPIHWEGKCPPRYGPLSATPSA